jgi:dolichol-phosphate mannosyltransferase
MYERLRDTFVKLAIEYEIIFVNDNSPDNSEEVIRSLSRRDRRIVGVSHSRNFGSQSAFRSGMEIASKNACVLLDGDLQDPPEMIEQFVELWRKGYRRDLRDTQEARGHSVYAVGLQSLLPDIRFLFLRAHPS